MSHLCGKTCWQCGKPIKYGDYCLKCSPQWLLIVLAILVILLWWATK